MAANGALCWPTASKRLIGSFYQDRTFTVEMGMPGFGLLLPHADDALWDIAAVAAAHKWFKLQAVWAFWIAYVMTRPFGASCGDLLSQARADGGLGLGTVGKTVLFLTVILALVTHLTISKRDVLDKTL